MLTLNRVHDLQKVPGKRAEVRLVGEHHYVRIVALGAPPIFVQDGQFYTEGGPPIPRKDITDAFWTEARKVTLDMRRTVGLVLPEEMKTTETTQAPPPPSVPVQTAEAGATAEASQTGATTKTCERCQEAVPTKAFGSHMAKHAREERKGN